MTDTAMCALIVQFWFDFRAAIHGPPMVDLICHHLLLHASVNFGPDERLLYFQTNFYCILFDNPAFHISQYTVLLSILIVTLIFDACIIHIMCRNWLKGLAVPLSVAVRVIIFCVYCVMVAVYVPLPICCPCVLCLII
ncbi:hypothetical protein JB92DRAFT_2906335 [Gautieria morchelliformis]|nr:hypothetical protein JB92DRAFT_2906335 [Gautieria morchelliformis]